MLCAIFLYLLMFHRQHYQILEVIPPHSNGTVNGHVKHHVEGDSIVISDSDDEVIVTSPTPPKTTPSGYVPFGAFF